MGPFRNIHANSYSPVLKYRCLEKQRLEFQLQIDMSLPKTNCTSVVVTL